MAGGFLAWKKLERLCGGGVGSTGACRDGRAGHTEDKTEGEQKSVNPCIRWTGCLKETAGETLIRMGFSLEGIVLRCGRSEINP